MEPEKNKYRLLMEHLPDAFAYHQIVTDSSGKPVDYIFLDVNPAFEKMTGLTREKIIGKKVTESLPSISESDFDWIGTYGKVALDGETSSFEEYLEPLGRWYEIAAYSDEPGFFGVFYRDKTEQKNLEAQQAQLLQVNERLQQRDALLQKLSQNVPGTIYQYQLFPDGRSCFPYSSAGIRNIYEVSPQEVRHDATKVYQRLHPDDYDGAVASIMESFHTLQQWTYEYRVLLPEKGERWIKGSATPEKLDDGSVLWHGEITDITERKRAEQALQEAYRRMDVIIECLPDATVVVDQTGTVIAWNKAMEEMTLVPKKEMLGKSDHEYAIPFYGKRQPILLDLVLLGEEEFARVKDQYDQIHWNGDTLFGEVYCPETYGGKGAFVWASATRLRDVSGNIFGAIESIRDITDRKEAEEERIARQAAEAANLTKSEFLANMSHEIRTPMNVIMGMTEIVYNSELNKEQKEYLGMVRDSTASLLTIINDILNFSKIEAGRLEMEVEDFNLYETVEQTTTSFALQAYQKGLELLLSIQPDVPQTVRGDPARLRQILINLLGNALKFTDTGEIILSLSKGQAGPGEIKDTENPAQPGSGASQQGAGPVSEMLIFSIKDTGAGIPRDKQALLFERFSQVDSSSTRRQEGTGLGLAISKKLVELMGGSIGVESEPGRGSTFTFRVPLCLPVAAAAEKLPATPEHFFDVQVLVIDDNKASCLIIKEMLQSRGLTVQTAPGGREGLEIMRHHATKGKPFDLLVLDQQMPGMDGFQVAEQINREKLLQGATLIMLSSVDMNIKAARRDVLGLFSYLIKPVKPSELFSHIHAALYKAKQQKPIREGEAPVKTAEADQAEQPEAGQGTKLQILLVEDKPMNRKLATTLLEKRGWSVTEAFHGRQALALLATHSFDLVLMDIQMPEMDGIETTKHIRNQEKTTGTRIPIIAMTAHTMQGDRNEFIEAGMGGYVSKPINAEELYRAVEEAAAATKAEGALEITADSASLPPQESKKPAEPEAVDLVDTGEMKELFEEVAGMLKTLGGDKKLLAEMVALLLEDAPKDLEQLRELLARRDGKNAALVAHGLKGQLGNLGMERGHNTAQSLEKALREGQFDQALTCLDALEKELNLLQRFFARPDWKEML